MWEEILSLSDAFFGEQAVEFIHALDGHAVEFDDDVALLDSGSFGWAAGLDLDDQHAAVEGEFVEPHDPALQRDILAAKADVAAFDPAKAEQLGRDELGGVAGDGEADSLGRTDDRGVDADDLAAAVDERAAAVAGV
jgi:hypothetical protein